MSELSDHLNLLGLRVADKVTGVEGVVSSVSFDLYGCVQVLVERGYDGDGKRHENVWLDIVRCQPLSDEPVMERPDFVEQAVHGPADKPAKF